MQSDGGVTTVGGGEGLDILARGGVGAVVPGVGVAGGNLKGICDGVVDGEVEGGEFTARNCDGF